ncbi:hypothetical protein CERZMDRAFT_83016 [Cercospora zeae-maydis SCOH1-5]|uniref:Uncharacterized protein n=1 Tax=Cercospora zeae-maydis SCOH1-5 TaxID=717836 RepID=A0A6A6FLV1_9PEZI|nr:hypothetical protein CERZMDRAFT_83016 [Cercospora zeae-maydis SCOH1-5]
MRGNSAIGHMHTRIGDSIRTDFYSLQNAHEQAAVETNYYQDEPDCDRWNLVSRLNFVVLDSWQKGYRCPAKVSIQCPEFSVCIQRLIVAPIQLFDITITHLRLLTANAYLHFPRCCERARYRTPGPRLLFSDSNDHLSRGATNVNTVVSREMPSGRLGTSAAEVTQHGAESPCGPSNYNSLAYDVVRNAAIRVDGTPVLTISRLDAVKHKCRISEASASTQLHSGSGVERISRSRYEL